jgi:putative membrane protein
MTTSLPSRYLARYLAATIVTAVLLGACDRADRATVDTALGAAGDTISAVAGRVTGAEYSNAELLGFVNAYNDAEIEIGQMAQPKATDAQVRDFARRIVDEHRALKTEVTSAAQGLSLTPTMPAADEGLRSDHAEGMRDLTARTRGRQFDEAFLEHEIKMHKKVLDEVEDALQRNRNPEIRPLLEKARDGLRAHLTTAEELEKKFGA